MRNYNRLDFRARRFTTALVFAAMTATVLLAPTVGHCACAIPPAGDPDCDGLLEGLDPCPNDSLNHCNGPVAACALGAVPSDHCAAGVALRLDLGDSAPTVDCAGSPWAVDQGPGTAVTATTTMRTKPIVGAFGCTNAATQSLTASAVASAWLSRSYPVANGEYTVNLLFAETNPASCVVAARTIDIYLEGGQVAGGPAVGDGFDIHKTSLIQNGAVDACGGLVVRSFRTTVADGALDLVLIEDRPTAGAAEAILAGIEVLEYIDGCFSDEQCDDGVSCTLDLCDLTTHECSNPPVDADCDDGSYCNGAETCDTLLGCISGALPDCDDGVACTIDLCDATLDACTQTADDVACADGSYCNGIELCDLALGCVAGQAADCDDGIVCTLDTCDDLLADCTHTADDTACDDALFCNGYETCDAALGCLAGAIIPCDDGVACTVDVCDEATDGCGHTASDYGCDDGLFCNGAEACDAALGCVAGPPVVCDDGIACTVDVCDEAADSCASLTDDGACDDGLFCNGAEACDAAAGCVTAAALPCDDGVDCTADACDESTDGCSVTAVDADCDDADACNGSESCDAALGCLPGEVPDCDDANPCTIDSCDAAGGCMHEPAPAGTSCADDLFCNGAETCDGAGTCTAGPAPDTDDGIACTIDTCDESADAILHTPDDGFCDDGLFCNGTETCDAAADCLAGQAPPLDDGIDCTRDSCNETDDTIVHTPDDGLCDDGVGCTDDVCTAEGCTHTIDDLACDDGLFCNGTETCDAAVDCLAGTPVDCDDGVDCSADACDDTADACTHSAADASCDDGLFCNGAETCDVSAGCTAGVAPAIDDGIACTADSCDENLDTVTHLPDDAFCDDGRPCNGAEACDATAGCTAGEPVRCDDSIACTADACDDASGACVYQPDDGVCDDGAFCNGLETCDPLAGCVAGDAPVLDDGIGCTVDTCDEAADTVRHLTDDGTCDDGAFCNGVETCDADAGCAPGTTVVCDDGVACTSDRCDESLDACVAAVDDAACDDGLFCNGVETCDADAGCRTGNPIDCNDGVDCTGDTCDEQADTCENTPRDERCTDGTFCNGVETCDPATGCTPGAAPSCDDGVDCTSDRCDAAIDACVSTPADSICDDGALCNGAETCDAALGCLAGTRPNCDDGIDCTYDVCDGGKNACRHLEMPLFCEDDLYCNGLEYCDVERGCQHGPAPSCDDGVDCTVDACDEAVDACTNTAAADSCDDDNPCTDDACSAESGCSHVANNAACDDGSACTVDDLCSDGACVAGAARDCDDGNDCTDDACSDASGCANTPNTAPCDDGSYCTSGDVCADGQCGGTARDCDDAVNCTLDACDEAADACTHDPQDSACDDGSFCNGVEVCDPTLDCVGGLPPSCDDAVACTTDSCDEEADDCLHAPDDSQCDDDNGCTDDACALDIGCTNAPNTAPCDDADACTLGDACIDGACSPGAPRDCNDGNACTADACDSDGDCTHEPDDVFCDDGSFCNGIETCDRERGCAAGTPPALDDGIDCTADRCDDDIDAVVHQPEDSACDDGAFCNGIEFCDAAFGCAAGAPSCDDGVPCTVDGCDENTDICTNAPSHAACDDGSICSGTELCDASVGCRRAGDAPDCSGLDTQCSVGFCDETTGGCATMAVNQDGPCEDGNACTVEESCAGGACLGVSLCGVPVSQGEQPTAVDGLFILRAAVGLAGCGLCECDINGDERIAVTDALAAMRLAVGLATERACFVPVSQSDAAVVETVTSQETITSSTTMTTSTTLGYESGAD